MPDLKFTRDDILIRLPAGTWCIEGKNSFEGGTVIRAKPPSSCSYHFLPDLPCPVSDWYIEWRERMHSVSIDFSDENIPIILASYDEVYPGKLPPRRSMFSLEPARSPRILTNDD